MTVLKVYPRNGHVRKASQSPYLSEMMREFWNNENEAVQFTNPKANISEHADKYEIMLALPGMRKKDVELTVEKDLLTISHKNTEEGEGVEYSRKEFDFRGFTRSFSLPETVNTGTISAKMDNGILRVSLPKKEEAVDKGPRRIDIS
jgi:HSP20 family protein